jgi:hypothetical protein
LLVSQLIHRRRGVVRLVAPALAAIVITTTIQGQGGPAGSSKLGEPFVMKLNDTSRLADENFSVRLDAVTEDSRCPVDVQCVWAGDALVELRVEKPPAAADARTLHANERGGRQAVYEGLAIRLLDLKPQRKEGTTIAPEDYRVTLVVERASRTQDDPPRDKGPELR